MDNLRRAGVVQRGPDKVVGYRNRPVATYLPAGYADAARGWVVLTLYRHDGSGEGSAAPLLIAEYADRYAREPDGTWLFAERRLAVLFGAA